MAVQPIDLQVMYTQMDKLAQTVSKQQNGLQLANAMQENEIIQQTKEQAAAVQKAAQNEAEIKMRDNDQKSSNNGQTPNGKKRQKTDDKDSSETPQQPEIRELYLGQHIDITG